MAIAIVWITFLVLVLFLIMLDLGVFHRDAHDITVKEAMTWTVVWIAFAFVVNVGVYFLYKHNLFGWQDKIPDAEKLGAWDAAIKFLTGYLVELSLSVDNLFVMAVIFRFFNVPNKFQHTVLFWGILTAVILRGVMIVAFGELFHHFEIPACIVFGSLLLFSGAKMLSQKEDEIDPDQSWLIRMVKKIYPVSTTFDGKKFFTKLHDGKTAITPLGLSLVLVEGADVMFAIDSVPAIYTITKVTFLVFASNICAIMGLRSMYFALAGMIDRFKYLKTALSFLLAFIGVKMLLKPLSWAITKITGNEAHFEIPTPISLTIIVGILAMGVMASMIAEQRDSGKSKEEKLVGDGD